MFSCLLTPSLWRNCCERPLSGYYQKSRTINHYSVNYVVWHFPRISFRLRVRETELRYGTGSGRVYESVTCHRKHAKQYSVINLILMWIVKMKKRKIN